jgi:hypothetical protein
LKSRSLLDIEADPYYCKPGNRSQSQLTLVLSKLWQAFLRLALAKPITFEVEKHDKCRANLDCSLQQPANLKYERCRRMIVRCYVVTAPSNEEVQSRKKI